MNNIEILEEFIEQYNASYPEEKECVAIYPNQIEAIENLIQENKELKEKLEEKDMQHELELIGKEEYTKDAMGEIIEHYYTANEDCIPKSKVKDKIEELEEQLKYNLFKNHEIYTVVENKLLHKIEVLQELLEGE